MIVDDLLISIAFFSIPIQLVVSSYRQKDLLFASMPMQKIASCVLFALFFFLCGFGYLMRYLHLTASTAYAILNTSTCIISLLAAFYLPPLIPLVLSELQDLEKLNEETEASKRKLFTFMSFLCHEIRNPLFAITSNIEFAQDMEMSNEMAESLQSIHQSSNLMLRLVNDVLDISKIESGKLELEEQEFDIREFFQNLASTMGRQIQAKRQGQVEFVFNMAHSLPRIVRSDSVRLLQIAYNILSNACKFTEHGTITFSVSLCNDKKPNNNSRDRRRLRHAAVMPQVLDLSGSDRGMFLGCSDHDKSDVFSMSLLQNAEEGVADILSRQKQQQSAEDAEIRVLKMTFEDTGTGIAPEHLGRIFQPYEQSKLSDFRKHGGTGLGLSIISKLLDMMGGKVKVSSTVDEGSKFVVLLPILVPNNQAKTTRKRNSFALLDGLVDSSELLELEALAAEESDPLEATPIVDTCPLVSWKRSSKCRAPPMDLLSQPSPQASPDMVPINSPPPVVVSACSLRSRSRSQSPRSRPALRKFKFPQNTNLVLVVDDNSVNRKLIGRMLSFFHVEYQTAEHGEEAVRIMRESRNITGNPAAPHFGMVLMDICMPVMDGYEAIECLRELEAQSHTSKEKLPIVALTGNAMDEEKRKAFEAGATDFATKPILRNVMHATCVKHMGQQR